MIRSLFTLCLAGTVLGMLPEESPAGQAQAMAYERLVLPLQDPPRKDPPPSAAPLFPGPGSSPAPGSPPRVPAPEAIRIREAEKLIRDLFKEDYARKLPGDRLALARRLLRQGQESTSDPAAQWVCFREAQDLALQAGDPETALLAIDRQSGVFEMDAFSAKMTALAAAAKLVKIPEEGIQTARLYLKLADEAMSADRYGIAEKAVQAAAPPAKKAGALGILARCSSRGKEIAEVKGRYDNARKAYEVLLKDPADPAANLELGQYLCFRRNDWDRGLSYLAKGSDPVLGSIARKELSLSADATQWIEVADGWWDLAEKEKNEGIRKLFYDRAAKNYRPAAQAASGLIRKKAEVRLEALWKRGVSAGMEIVLGGPKLESRGLVLVDVADGLYQAGIAGGKTFLQLLPNPERICRYLYFHLTEPWPGGVHPVEIEVEYLEDGGGIFDLEFDALSGVYRNTGQSVSLDGDRAWKTATFRLADPAFLGRLNNHSDFRLRREAGGDLFVHRVVLRLAER